SCISPIRRPCGARSRRSRRCSAGSMARAEFPPVRAFLQLARPAQRIKNGFVLLPASFGHALAQPEALRGVLLAALAFCLAASAVYAGNDIVDAGRDRHHPDKCRRPLARGALGSRAALGFAAALAAAALALAARVDAGVGLVVLAYLA